MSHRITARQLEIFRYFNGDNLRAAVIDAGYSARKSGETVKRLMKNQQFVEVLEAVRQHRLTLRAIGAKAILQHFQPSGPMRERIECWARGESFVAPDRRRHKGIQ